MLPDNYSEFGLNTPFVVKGQRLILNYDSSIREGLGADRVVIASLEGAGLPQKKVASRHCHRRAGLAVDPDQKTGFLTVRAPEWGKARADRRDARLNSASVKWGLMWRDPGADYKTRTMGDIAATPVDWKASAH